MSLRRKLRAALLLCVPLSLAQIRSPSYPLKQRRAQTKTIAFGDLNAFALTFSDDSPPKVLDEFDLSLFETDGELPATPSLSTIEDSLSTFLKTKLGEHFGPNDGIDSVEVKVVNQSSTAGITSETSQQVVGSKLRTAVSVNFDHEPSPDIDEVNNVTMEAMKDLTGFVSALKVDAEGDADLEGLFFAFREEVVVADLTPVADISNGDNTRAPIMDSALMQFQFIIPILVAGSFIVLIIALFAVKRRRREQASEIQSETEEVIKLYMDEESDIFSVEAALVDSPIKRSRKGKAQQHSIDESDIFSGIGSEITSPHNGDTRSVFSSPRNGDARSVFSFFSGFSNFTRGEASTVVASNRTKKDKSGAAMASAAAGAVNGSSATQNGAATPHSRVSSLFTFSEEGSADLYSSGEEDEATPEDVKISTTVPKTITEESEGPKGGVCCGPVKTILTENGESIPDPEKGEVLLEKIECSTPTRKVRTDPFQESNLDPALAEITYSIEQKAPSTKSDPTVETKISAGTETTTPTVVTKTDPTVDTKTLSAVDKDTDPIAQTIDTSSYTAPTAAVNTGLAVATTSILAGAASTARPPLSPTKPVSLAKSMSMSPSKYKTKLSIVSTDDSSEFGPRPISATSSPRSPVLLSPLSTNSRVSESCNQADDSRVSPNKSLLSSKSAFSSKSALTSPRNTFGNSTSMGTSQKSLNLVGPSETSTDHFTFPEYDTDQTVSTEENATMSVEAANSAISAEAIQKELEEAERNQKSGKGRWLSGFRHLGRRTPTKTVEPALEADLVEIESTGSTTTGPEASVDDDNEQHLDLQWGNPKESAKNRFLAAEFAGTVSQIALEQEEEEAEARRGRRHAKSTGNDGTANYQTETMDARDASITSLDGFSLNSEKSEDIQMRISRIGEITTKSGKKVRALKMPKSPASQARRSPMASPLASPRGQNTPMSESSVISGLSTTSIGTGGTGSEASASKQVISDLVWLEKKLAGANHTVVQSPTSEASNPATLESEERTNLEGLEHCDSLSFVSGDNNVSNSESNGGDSIDISTPVGSRSPVAKGVQSIVCRDCYAPPGKLKIVIHSTKDGPAVHTVKKGSSLEGHIFAGDLIISVDNVDTRSYTAEQVMKMMTAKTRFERKITVLHFENENESEN